MKKSSALIHVFWWLFIFCFSVSAQDYKTVQDGVEYAELERAIGEKPVRMNLLRLDLTKVRLDVVHAMDAAIGTEKTSSIATRHGALAAINAGFFRLDTSIFAGDAVGILKIDGKVLSESSNNRIALLIKNEKTVTKVEFVRLNISMFLLAGPRIFQISGVNRERKNDEIILYTPEFHSTTLTGTDGLEIIVEGNKITRILNGKGSNRIPQNGFVISVTGKFIEELKYLKVGNKLSYALPPSAHNGLTDSSNSKISFSEDVTNGVPELIKDGKIDITWEQEKSSKEFVETRHPRTAVAKLKDGKFLMITIDGRSEASAGIGLEDLAKLLLEFGAVDAMNLDGGGSTTMFLDGKVVNKPSDKEGERRVSDAILVFPRRKSARP
ncbi:MAG TPA: phosphodiester glycosidase family protein [Pyrinomonadaceae bacterium]